MNDNTGTKAPMFYTIREAAKVLRIDPSTRYRAIREDAFPAIKIRNRAIEQMATEAAKTGCLVDIARMVTERRVIRELTS